MKVKKVKKEKWPKPQKFKTPDGTVVHTWDGKLHNWDGPALIPEGDKRKREYYIYGIQYDEEQWKEFKRDKTGLPWYKNLAMCDSARQGG
tara:strand:+ start:230 stop:499 length:270 start_codon:yes stop_codon:yes gene_type:complete